MDISLYLMSFLQYRIVEKPSFINVYIADFYEKGVVDIIINDDASRMNDSDEDMPQAFLNLKKICNKSKGQLKNLYHRKDTSVQMTWYLTTKNTPIALGDFLSLFGMLMLSHPEIDFVFSYLSDKGEYVFRSSELFKEFNEEELIEKETLHVFINLLQENVNDLCVIL